MTVRIIAGDCREMLRTLPAESVQCCVTSPPYWGLRDYGIGDAQIGLEQSPDEYVAQMVAVFREVKRVLREDGTVWLNLGDSYAGSGAGGGGNRKGNEHGQHDAMAVIGRPQPGNGLKPKDLCMIPARVALALQADGWWIRRQIIWAKGLSFCPTYSGSVMPESVRDRPSQSYEHVFLLAKSKRYFYDATAVREEAKDWGTRNRDDGKYHKEGSGLLPHSGLTDCNNAAAGRNLRSVWTIPDDEWTEFLQFREWKRAQAGLRDTWTINPKPYREAHFATYPPALIEPMIKAGSSERGCCTCGSPWKRVVEKERGDAPEPRGYQRNVHATTPHITHGYGSPNAVAFPDSMQLAPHVISRTIGWRPGCYCGTEHPIPQEELDADPTLLDFEVEPFDPVPCTILDPFSGAGTTGLVADRLGRDAILIDLNPDYCQMAYDRIRGENPMFTEVIYE